MFTVLIGLILFTILLGSIVPLVQFISFSSKSKEQNPVFRFSQKLFDMDMELTTEVSGDSKETVRKVNRFGLADRGWIRCPNGTVMDDRDFSRKKSEEYKLELP